MFEFIATVDTEATNSNHVTVLPNQGVKQATSEQRGRSPLGRSAEREIWTRMQRIRTAGEMGFKFKVFAEQFFLYQDISDEAKKLFQLGVSYRGIGKALGINDKTAKKAILNEGIELKI